MKISQENIDWLLQFALDGAINLLLAIATLVIGFWVARRAASLLIAGLEKRGSLDDTLRPVVIGLVRYTIIGATIIAVLSQFGFEIASLLAVLGALGLAIGLSLQGTLSNVAAGVMLLTLRPFKVGEFVTVGAHSGTAIEIGLFTTELKTADGVYISVPNGTIWGSAIINFSRNSDRRIDIVASIAYDDDLEAAMPLLLTLMTKDSRVLKDPEPQTFLAAMAASSIDIQMRCWVKGDDYWATLWDLNKAVKLTLDSNGYSIPFPQQDVHLHTVAAEAAE